MSVQHRPATKYLAAAMVTATFLIAGCRNAGNRDADISVTVVDMHSHLFNARDLPLAGIANARGVPMGVARSVATLLNNWTRLDDDDRRLRSVAGDESANGDAGAVARQIRANFRSNREINRRRIAVLAIVPRRAGGVVGLCRRYPAPRRRTNRRQRRDGS